MDNHYYPEDKFSGAFAADLKNSSEYINGLNAYMQGVRDPGAGFGFPAKPANKIMQVIRPLCG